MHLAFHGAIHPAGFTAAGQHNTEAEQQPAEHRASPHDFRLGTQLDIAEDADGAHRHPKNNRFSHMGAAGYPHIAKRGGKADLRAFDKQAETDAEQHREAQFRRVHGREQCPANHARKHQHPDAKTALRLVRLLRQRRGGAHFLHFYRNTKQRQQGKTRAEPRADGCRQREKPGVQRELRNAGKKRRQVAAHRQTRAEARDDAARDRLNNADAMLWHTQLHIVGPQRRREAAAEHPDNHHPVDAGQRGAFEMNQLVVAPVFSVNAEEL